MALLLLLWEFLPAYFANSAPLILQKLMPAGLRRPVDMGATLLDGRRVLGEGKTFAGFISGVTAGTFVGYAQGQLFMGILLGLGAMVGDMAGSFFRRRMGLPRGGDVPLLNQLDFVAGALLLSSLERHWSLAEIAVICLVTVPLHRLTNWAAFRLGIKGEPW